MFLPKASNASIRLLMRGYCDQVATAVLDRIIESGAHRRDLIVSAEQKQRYLDLWSSMVFEAGSRVRTGKTQKIFLAAQQAEVAADPQQAELQAVARTMYDRTKYTPGASTLHFWEIVDLAFGPGAFDHSNPVRCLPGVELASCIRFVDYVAARTRV